MSSEDSPLILYSSQTGTSKSIAELFISDDYTPTFPGIVPRCYDFTAYMKVDPDFSLLAKEKNPVLFLVSTTGQGDFPDNALPFMRIIRRLDKKIQAGCPKEDLPFFGKKMINLGLGDSNYDKFNGGIEQVEKYLVKMGFEKLAPTVFADDGIGLELGVERWRRETLVLLKKWEEDKKAVGGEKKDEVGEKNEEKKEEKKEEITPTVGAAPKIEQTVPVKPQPSHLQDKLFVLPNTSVLPPVDTTKPQFLMKKHQNKIQTLLLNNHNQNIFEQNSNLISQHSAQIREISNSNFLHRKTLKSLQADGANPTPLYSADTPSGGLIIGSQLLLEQFIAITNVEEFLQEKTEEQTEEKNATKQFKTSLLEQLTENEYGYSNINTLPIFGQIGDIHCPSIEADNHSGQFDGLKTTIDVTMNISDNTARVLKSLSVVNIDNPSTTVDYFGQNDSDSGLKITSLYRPGDSVSIICPNNYNSVQNILKHTNLNQFSEMGVILSEKSDILTTKTDAPGDDIPSIAEKQDILTVKSPLTHIHCFQPDERYVNNFILTKNEQSENSNSAAHKNGNTDLIPSSNPTQNEFFQLGGVFFEKNSKNALPLTLTPTLSSLLTHAIDISAPIKKALLRCFADTCKDFPVEQNNEDNKQYQKCVVQTLYHLMSKAGIGKATKTEIEQQFITICDLLELFSVQCEIGQNDSTIQPDLNDIIELTSSLKPRSYSISSSPYKNMLNEFDGQNVDFLQNNFVQNFEKFSEQKKVELIAGTSFRFALTLTDTDLPPLSPITKADYEGALPLPKKFSELSNQNYINQVNSNFGGKNNRKYSGLCTHFFLNIFYDLGDYKQSNCQSNDDFVKFMNSKSLRHSNPRFWGCIAEKVGTENSIKIHLPFFFHTSPTFHPPNLLIDRKFSPKNQQVGKNNKNDPNCDEKEQNVSPNMLLFGPGTGSSPFLSFIEHKFYTNILNSFIKTTSSDKTAQFLTSLGTLDRILQTTRKNIPSIDLFNNDSINIGLQNQVQIVNNDYNSIVLKSSKPQSHDHKISLFTGNRYRNKDYLHAKHWLEMLTVHDGCHSASLDQLYSIFSREKNLEADETAENKKKYVQDLITMNGSDISKHILSGGFVFVCGDGVSMAKQVQKTIENALTQYGQLHHTLYSSSYDIINPVDNDQLDSNSNVINYQGRYSTDKISSTLIDYIQKDPASFQTQFERESWAKGIVAVMIKSGRYNTDVW